MKKKSLCASVKARLHNINNILKKYIIREKFGLGVTGGRSAKRKETNKAVNKTFCFHRAGGSQDPTDSHHGDSSSFLLLCPLALQYIPGGLSGPASQMELQGRR